MSCTKMCAAKAREKGTISSMYPDSEVCLPTRYNVRGERAGEGNDFFMYPDKEVCLPTRHIAIVQRNRIPPTRPLKIDRPR